MKHGRSVTFKQVESAAYDVQCELAELGLWHEGSRLLDVDVIWCRVPQITLPSALGFYTPKCGWFDRMFGYEAGHIYIPQWVLINRSGEESESLRNLLRDCFKQQRGSLRDILRHEYGHALAYRYPKQIRRSRKFREAFGAGHDEEEYDPGWLEECGDDAFVSEYAMTSPSEDFAETFSWWVRCRGERPAGLSDRSLRRKWKFVSETAGILAS